MDVTLRNVLIILPLWFPDQRCGPGALRTPLLSERTKKHQGCSADRRLQFEYHAADAQEGKVTLLESSSFSVLSWRRHGNEAECCPVGSGSAGFQPPAACVFIGRRAGPQTLQPHMLVPRAWLPVCVQISPGGFFTLK